MISRPGELSDLIWAHLTSYLPTERLAGNPPHIMNLKLGVQHIGNRLGTPIRILRGAQLIQSANKSSTQPPIKLQD